MARQTAPEKARAEVERLEKLAVRWEADAAALVERIGDVERTRGSEVIDAGDDGPERAREIVAVLTELRGERDTATAAAAAARDQLEEARRDVLRADAAHMRDEAAAKRTEADRREKTTTKLLEQLREHEGCEYRPRVLAKSDTDLQPTWQDATPRTARLRGEADKLVGRAVVLEGEAEGLAIRPPNDGLGLDYAALANPTKAALATQAARQEAEQRAVREEREQRQDRSEQLRRELDGKPVPA